MAEPQANLDRFYGELKNYVKMAVTGYTNMLMLDAKGGLGKTHNVCQVLDNHYDDNAFWYHQKGFTTPIELYKTLWEARQDRCTLFLDDMSGVTNNTKAIDMLKSATDTQGEENVVQYQTSRDIDHPFIEGATIPNSFTFRGTVIMSFNDTPDNRHFDALKDRGTYYNFTLSYQERLDLLDEIAKLPDFSNLSVFEQQRIADWVRITTDCSYEVTIRTFEEICKMREFGEDTGADWEKMAIEIFDIDYEEYLIIDMREANEMPVEKQIETFIDKTGTSQSHYYDVLDKVREKRDMN